jgi:hypothetical protein
VGRILNITISKAFRRATISPIYWYEADFLILCNGIAVYAKFLNRSQLCSVKLPATRLESKQLVQ